MYTEEPPQDGERLVTLRRVGDVGAVGVAYHIPAGPHEDVAPLQVLANILSTTPSGRLHKLLVETKQAAHVFVSARGQHDPGLMTMQATVRDPQVLDNVRDTMLDAVEQIGATGVTAEEVTRAKQQILKARALAADTSQIAIALSEWAAQGDWRLYFLARDRIAQVRLRLCRPSLRGTQRNNRTVGVFIPTDKPERVAIPSTPTRRPPRRLPGPHGHRRGRGVRRDPGQHRGARAAPGVTGGHQGDATAGHHAVRKCT